VITNLVGNAVKFTHKGEVLVSVTWRPEVIGSTTPASFDVSKILDGASAGLRMVELHFSVKDTGIGIPPEKLEILFNKFTQVDASVTREFGGTGLGLAISKQLVELMGGSIGVESSVGQGSEFWFTVRLHMQDEKHKTDELLSVFKDVRVLLLHQENTGSKILKAKLNQLGLQVDVVHDQNKAIESLNYAADEGHPIRLALLDLQLPGMDVMSLANDIRSDPHISGTRLVLLSSFGNVQNDDLYIKDGFWGVIGKPVTQKELRKVLHTTITGRNEERGRHLERHEELIKTVQFPELTRILLVEDNLTNQQVATGILKKIGAPHVDLALNGQLALEALEKQNYDLVLMDVQMPVMDGLEATRRLRSYDTLTKNFGVPIVAMTARALAGDRERCLEAGMNDYIAKPFDPAQLVEGLKRWIILENKGEPVFQDRYGDPVFEKAMIEDPNPQNAPVIFDREGLLDRLMHDDELIKLVVDGFVENIPQQIIALKQYLAEGDIKSAERQAHTIKGAAANLGGEVLRAVASDMEKAGHAGNSQTILEAVPELERQYNILRDILTSDLYK
ncbi:MAG: response regulator, partial [Chloroflexota bacterium]